jgi:hypothetical protein
MNTPFDKQQKPIFTNPPILDRIEKARKRFEQRDFSMRVPPDPTDIDIVLADCAVFVRDLQHVVGLLRNLNAEFVPFVYYITRKGGLRYSMPGAVDWYATYQEDGRPAWTANADEATCFTDRQQAERVAKLDLEKPYEINKRLLTVSSKV